MSSDSSLDMRDLSTLVFEQVNRMVPAHICYRQDVAQDVLLEIHTRREAGQIDDLEQFLQEELRRIIRNCAQRYARKAQRRRKHEHAYAEMKARESTPPAERELEIKDYLNRFGNSLPSEHKRVLQQYLEDRSYFSPQERGDREVMAEVLDVEPARLGRILSGIRRRGRELHNKSA